MPFESALFVTAVVLMFTAFVLALAWAERQTRGVADNDIAARRPAE